MDKLRDLGADIAYSDPHIPVFPVIRKYSFKLTSVELTPESLSIYDCVLLATDHDKFDYGLIKENAKVIVDSRGRYLAVANNIVRA
jgi:UDP-N-acetyl-D-glucosamine dehydrogenase